MSTPNTHYGARNIALIMENCRNKKVFFSGAGGVMMSSLALLTKQLGYSVYGSDRSRSAITESLENDGIILSYEQKSENLDEDFGAFIYTVAIPPDNPEYLKAGELSIPRISRADYLGYIMTEYKNRIGIAGMHGKSTVTSMCAQILLDAEKKEKASAPTIISGAEYKPMGGAYKIGEHDNFLFEACEYMDSFLDFNPTIAVLLNAEMEHVDYFKSMAQIISSFSKYASLTGESGYAVANADDENIMAAVKDYKGQLITFGLKNKTFFSAKNIKTNGGYPEFDITYDEKVVAHILLKVSGEHNIMNSLAAAAACRCLGIDFETIKTGLENFCGAGRRMEYKGMFNGARVWDDYGHHPTEVKATLKGAKEMCGENKLICVFQPHTYSRTKALADQFKEAFEPCDRVILCDIYAAREKNIYNISSSDLVNMIGDKAIYGGNISSCAEKLKSIVNENDTVVIMGAGDIYKIYKEIRL